MAVDDTSTIIERLRQHLLHAKRLDVLVRLVLDLRLRRAPPRAERTYRRASFSAAARSTSCRSTDLDEEHMLRARLEQHRIAREFLTWAEQHLQVRSLNRRSRDSWTVVDGPEAYAVHGAGFEAESLGLVSSSSLLFPREIHDADQIGGAGAQL